jgi:sigma-E factor negative regulatory protein RseA
MDKISALMDGELDSAETEVIIARIKSSEDYRAGWEVFHLIGDTLRQNYPLSARFTERLGRRLAQEPTILAPRRRRPSKIARVTMPLAAAAAAVAMVGWLVLSTHQGAESPGTGPMIATNTPQATPVNYQTPVSPVPDSRLQDYLVLHHPFSPGSMLQTASPEPVAGIQRTSIQDSDSK